MMMKMEMLQDVQLKPYNSFRVSARARLFCYVDTPQELKEVLALYPHEKKLVLGGGYNMLFTTDFDGLIIQPVMKQIQVLSEDNDRIEIEAGAAVVWDDFVDYCVRQGYAGLENLSLIPGTVGASPVQNIGAYGAEVKDGISAVRAMELSTGKAVVFSHADCRFSYRDSLFKHERNYVITSVVFRLHKTFVYQEKYVDLSRELKGVPHPTLQQVRQAVIRIRERKLPDYATLPNAGSFFKNPLLTGGEKEALLSRLPDAPVYAAGEGRFKTSAAYLIDKAGYKGKRRGMVGTYPGHALIMVNYGTDKGSDIIDFMKEVQEAVRDRFCVALEPEVRIY